ncbi:PAQR family membrane homeostasis protein TrhA [Larsenimonas rhizosphaerae]|uniref:Hemolysin III family protein n=1 Tax=Larsenimonas rhizosphaerae TaxID=2944682 RepID=A0AA41ZGE4_9GAMM|nr:hemolysin III family protein [Larsenimonas rhizosphaerae]MCM2129490.1 hemolysin III family protein [Larsenimonas rhizosphaerae]MCX2524146.1 hemolysin III family protein [Larsenimonas rhizosphaerae]
MDKQGTHPIERFEEEYTRLEEWLSSSSHAVGALLSIAGLTVLIVMASVAARVDPWKIVSISLYGASLIALYVVSTVYHFTRRPRLKRLFQHLDHCAIYLLIAGTYTPFVLVNMRGPTGWGLFAAVWGLAIFGIVVKACWPYRLEALRVTIYLVMGWLMVFFTDQMVASLSPEGVRLLIAGGIIYTVGVVFYAISAIPYGHAIWHLFVLGGSVCHFLAIYHGVLSYPYPSS